jgi:hypothetical protein
MRWLAESPQDFERAVTYKSMLFRFWKWRSDAANWRR